MNRFQSFAFDCPIDGEQWVFDDKELFHVAKTNKVQCKKCKVIYEIDPVSITTTKF